MIKPKNLVFIALLVATLGSCRVEPTDRVVLYVSADEHFAREIVALFEQATGIRVDVVPDTEARKTTGLVQRLRQEADHPRADVFWSSEIFLTMALADEGVLAPCRTPETKAWPEAWRDPEYRWFGFAARARVIAVSTERVTEAERPAAWTDLADERWRGRIVMADPRFGTTGGHLGAMATWWNDRGQADAYEQFLETLAANDTRLLPSGNAGVVRAIATGEADVGLTDTDDVWAARRQGHAIDLVYARHGDGAGGGTLLIPNTVALVRGGPNADPGKRLVEFLLSETVERHLAESDSRNVPLRPGVADSFPELSVPDPLNVDFAAAARHRDDAVDQAMRVLGGGASP